VNIESLERRLFLTGVYTTYDAVTKKVTVTTAGLGISNDTIVMSVSGGGTFSVSVGGVADYSNSFANILSISVDGGSGNDSINLGATTNPITVPTTINGGNGDDTITSGAGPDQIYGGNGNDSIDGGLGADSISGGANNDTVSYATRATAVNVTLNGLADDGAAGEHDNVGFGTTDVESIMGGSGNDTLTGDADGNYISGGAGKDLIHGMAGSDTIVGGAGGDSLYGDDDNDYIFAKDGEFDLIDGGLGVDSASVDTTPVEAPAVELPIAAPAVAAPVAAAAAVVSTPGAKVTPTAKVAPKIAGTFSTRRVSRRQAVIHASIAAKFPMPMATGPVAPMPMATGPIHAPVLPPDQITGVTTQVAPNQVTISWTADPVADAYNVRRSVTAAGPFVLIKTGNTSTSFVDNSAVSGTVYFYEVEGTNSAGPGPASTPVAADLVNGVSVRYYNDQFWRSPQGNTTGYTLPSLTGVDAGAIYSQDNQIYSPNKPPVAGIRDNNWSDVITGRIVIPDSAVLNADGVTIDPIVFVSNTDDDGYLLVDGQLVASDPGSHGPEDAFLGGPAGTPVQLTLSPGVHEFVHYHSQGGGGASAALKWITHFGTPQQTPLAVVPAGDFLTTATVPVAPTNVNASQAPVGGVQIIWTDNSKSELNFQVQRSISPNFALGTVQTIATLPANDAVKFGNIVKFTDTGNSGVQTNYYRIVAANFDGSNISTSATVPAFAVAQSGAEAHFFNNQWWNSSDQSTNGPTTTGASVIADVNTIVPTVDAHGADPDSFHPGVRSTNFSSVFTGQLIISSGGFYNFPIQTDDDGYLYVDGQLVAADPGAHGARPAPIQFGLDMAAGNHNFQYFQSQGGGGWDWHLFYNGPDTNNTDAIVPAGALPPLSTPVAAPATVTFSNVSSGAVTINWGDTNTSEIQYIVERSTDNFVTNDTVVGTTGINGTSFTDLTVLPQTSYIYRVHAVNFDSVGDFALGSVPTPAAAYEQPIDPANVQAIIQPLDPYCAGQVLTTRDVQGTVTANGTSGDDVFLVATAPGQAGVQVTNNGGFTEWPLASSPVIINGQGGANDQLIISGANVSYTPGSVPGSGVVISDGHTIAYNDMGQGSPVFGGTGTLTVVTPGAGDLIHLGQSPTGSPEMDGTSDGVAFSPIALDGVQLLNLDIGKNGTGPGGDTVNADNMGPNAPAVGILASGAASGATTVNVNSGLLVLANNPASGANSNFFLNVNNGASIRFTAQVTNVGQFNLIGQAQIAQGGGRVLIAKSLNINQGGTLDLTDNSFILAPPAGSPPTTQISSLIDTSFHNGWQGTGIVSSVAAVDTKKAIGFADAGALFGAAGGTFQGVPVNASATLVRVTTNGDFNLDGTVGFADLVAVGQHYGLAANNTWLNGDANFDGQVNFADLVVLGQNYGL